MIPPYATTDFSFHFGCSTVSSSICSVSGSSALRHLDHLLYFGVISEHHDHPKGWLEWLRWLSYVLRESLEKIVRSAGKAIVKEFCG